MNALLDTAMPADHAALLANDLTVFPTGQPNPVKTGETVNDALAMPACATLTVFPTGQPNPVKTVKTVNIGNDDFLAEVFRDAPADGVVSICSLSGDPEEHKGWPVRPWPAVSAMLSPERNNFFALATFKRQTDGSVRRRKQDSPTIAAFLLDDLGTKASFERLEGLSLSWLIETSPGNFQGGLILDAPTTDVKAAARFQDALIAAGLCDEGAKSPETRLARLPVGINGKTKHRDADGNPFRCRLVEWRPEVRYSMEELVDRLGLDVTRPARSPRQKSVSATPPANHVTDDLWVPAPAENPVIVALKAAGLYKFAHGDGKHEITCPWVDEHTSGDRATVYFEPSAVSALGGFKCQHTHGDRLNIRDLCDFLGVSLADARAKPVIRVKAGELDGVVDAAEAELASRGEYYNAGG